RSKWRALFDCQRLQPVYFIAIRPMKRTASSDQLRVPSRQRGFALILVFLVLGVAFSSLLFSYITPFGPTINNDKVTSAALVQARAALTGVAAGVNLTGAQRPGDLPCPDLNNDGTAEASCSTLVSRIGRLPWKTLGLPDLRDGAGERLWYAVSTNFKNNPRT